MGDLLLLGAGAVRSHRLRSLLSMLGIAIGIASVIILTSIGEGTRRYVLDQFSQFGTNVIAINPGKVKTMGIPGVLGGTTKKLTIEDAEALRRAPGVERVVPVAFGQARVEAGGRGRSVYIYGVTSDMPDLWQVRIQYGEFLPAGDPRRAQSVCVLGPKLKHELFGEETPLGQFVRIGGQRFRVLGVMQPKGRILGFDIDDCAYVPVKSAMRLYNMEELSEIDVTFSHNQKSEDVAAGVKALLTARHGSDDFTVTTQDAMLEVFGDIMNIVTLAVGAIGGISLVVGAIGILTMMWIAVRERTSEIGLVRAVGASRAQVRWLFLFEAVFLSLLGGAAGVLLGVGGGLVARLLVPGLPVFVTPASVAAGLTMSAVAGILSGVLPAMRAARLEPIEALRVE